MERRGLVGELSQLRYQLAEEKKANEVLRQQRGVWLSDIEKTLRDSQDALLRAGQQSVEAKNQNIHLAYPEHNDIQESLRQSQQALARADHHTAYQTDLHESQEVIPQTVQRRISYPQASEVERALRDSLTALKHQKATPPTLPSHMDIQHSLKENQSALQRAGQVLNSEMDFVPSSVDVTAAIFESQEAFSRAASPAEVKESQEALLRACQANIAAISVSEDDGLRRKLRRTTELVSPPMPGESYPFESAEHPIDVSPVTTFRPVSQTVDSPPVVAPLPVVPQANHNIEHQHPSYDFIRASIELPLVPSAEVPIPIVSQGRIVNESQDVVPMRPIGVQEVHSVAHSLPRHDFSIPVPQVISAMSSRELQYGASVAAAPPMEQPPPFRMSQSPLPLSPTGNPIPAPRPASPSRVISPTRVITSSVPQALSPPALYTRPLSPVGAFIPRARSPMNVVPARIESPVPDLPPAAEINNFSMMPPSQLPLDSTNVQPYEESFIHQQQQLRLQHQVLERDAQNELAVQREKEQEMQQQLLRQQHQRQEEELHMIQERQSQIELVLQRERVQEVLLQEQQQQQPSEVDLSHALYRQLPQQNAEESGGDVGVQQGGDVGRQQLLLQQIQQQQIVEQHQLRQLQQHQQHEILHSDLQAGVERSVTPRGRTVTPEDCTSQVVLQSSPCQEYGNGECPQPLPPPTPFTPREPAEYVSPSRPTSIQDETVSPPTRVGSVPPCEYVPPAQPTAPSNVAKESWDRLVSATNGELTSEELALMSLDTLKNLLKHYNVSNPVECARIEVYWQLASKNRRQNQGSEKPDGKTPKQQQQPKTPRSSLNHPPWRSPGFKNPKKPSTPSRTTLINAPPPGSRAHVQFQSSS